MLAVDASCLDISFSRLSFLCSFSFSLRDGPIKTKTLPQSVVKLTSIRVPSRAEKTIQTMGRGPYLNHK